MKSKYQLELDAIREELKGKPKKEIDVLAKKHGLPPKKCISQYVETGDINDFIKTMLKFLKTWGVKDGTIEVDGGACNADVKLHCYVDKNEEEVIEEVVQLEHLSRNMERRELAELERLKTKYEGKNGNKNT